MNKGVYIVDLEGKLYNVSDWNNGSDATGVALVTDKVSIIIAKDEWYLDDDVVRNSNTGSAWGGYGLQITNIESVQSGNAAIKDFDGSSNTDAMLTAINSPAAEYCRAYFKGYKGVGEWYLPAMGEYNEIVENYKAINVALRAIDGVPLYKNLWAWTSTQYSGTGAWHYHWDLGYFDRGFKYCSLGIRPICKL